MDSLSALLQDLQFNAEVFFSGKLCGLQVFEEDKHSGVLHFVKAGKVTLQSEQGHSVILNPSAVIFIPDGIKHQLKVKQNHEVELVCASIKIPNQQRLLLTEHLPKFLCVNAEDDPDLSDIARRIFDEAFSTRHGRQIMIDRLCDMFVVQILRHVIHHGIVDLGMLSGSAHPRLSQLMQAIGERPQHPWSVEEMARQVAMSRSKFAEQFKETVGLAPMEYLTELRLGKARELLLKQTPVSIVANDVGYESASSLARVFKKRFGVTPKQWIKRHWQQTGENVSSP